MAQYCSNCLQKVRFWSNHSGYCSKQCREESTTSCPNCGTVGLFKHNRLGCCSEECRCWFASALLGYDRDALLTPAPDKVVYHVRLPSNNAEISSLQLDELEYERRMGTVLVIAAPPWMSRHRVLAELPYERFDNEAWQHLRADGTLSEGEVERFRGYLYDEPLLYQRLGLMVYARLKGDHANGARTVTALPAPAAAMTGVLALASATNGHTPGRGLPLAQSDVPSHQLASLVRTLFEARGYAVASTRYGDEEVLMLMRGSRQAIARYYWSGGVVDTPPIEEFVRWMTDSGVEQGYFVTNGRFSLQAEDWVAHRPVQLIDGADLRGLLKGPQGDLFLAAKETYTAQQSTIAVEEETAAPLELDEAGVVTGETRPL